MNIIFQPSALSKFLYNRTVLTTQRACSSKVPGNAGLPKAQKISKAMKIYLERSQSHNEMMKEEVTEFEVGKRYLAGMMGLDADNINQQHIDEAIKYLLPSGLFDKKARPKMKHPLDVLPKRKAAQFGLDGRPFNTFFYTSKQNYAAILHTVCEKMDELKKIEDTKTNKTPGNKIELKGSEWLSLEKVNQTIEEKLLEPEYKVLLSALEHLSQLDHSITQHSFIFQFRLNLLHQNSLTTSNKTPALENEEGRTYYQTIGKRKKARADVKLYEKGDGDIRINNLSLLHFFPRLADREQVLYPLHLMGLLGKVDVVVEVEGGGPSGQAGAARLAIARSLENIVEEKDAEKLRISGLLTSDPRTLERQKPGKSGARRSYTWKKR